MEKHYRFPIPRTRRTCTSRTAAVLALAVPLLLVPEYTGQAAFSVADATFSQVIQVNRNYLNSSPPVEGSPVYRLSEPTVNEITFDYYYLNSGNDYQYFGKAGGNIDPKPSLYADARANIRAVGDPQYGHIISVQSYATLYFGVTYTGPGTPASQVPLNLHYEGTAQTFADAGGASGSAGVTVYLNGSGNRIDYAFANSNPYDGVPTTADLQGTYTFNSSLDYQNKLDLSVSAGISVSAFPTAGDYLSFAAFDPFIEVDPSFPNRNDYQVVMSVNATPVPEATTLIAGALLLLPLGLSAVRALRRKQYELEHDR
ncbi:MAG: hypothetical protein AB9869_17750 [Verrucomicrobiia bacterium]